MCIKFTLLQTSTYITSLSDYCFLWQNSTSILALSDKRAVSVELLLLESPRSTVNIRRPGLKNSNTAKILLNLYNHVYALCGVIRYCVCVIFFVMWGGAGRMVGCEAVQWEVFSYACGNAVSLVLNTLQLFNKQSLFYVQGYFFPNLRWQLGKLLFFSKAI